MAFGDIAFPFSLANNPGKVCAQSNRPVWIDANTVYVIYANADNSDIYWTKSTDGGVTWRIGSIIKASTIIGIATWFDKWTPGDTGTVIHIAYMDSANHDVYYRELDTSDDSLGSEITVVDDASYTAGANTCLSITKTREPKIIVAFDGDAGTETGTHESDDYPVTAFSALANDINEGTSDYYWLAPGNETGTDEFYALFFDRSAGALTLKYGNGSAGYTEVAVGTLTNIAASTVAPQVAICIGTNGHTYVVWWTNSDNSNADLNFCDITNGATVGAAVKILDSSDDQGGCALGINTTDGKLYVFYLGLTAGTDTAYTLMTVNYRTSSDSGANWSAEQNLSGIQHVLNYISCSLEFANDDFFVMYGGSEVANANMFNAYNIPSAAGGGTDRRSLLTGGIA